MSRSSHAHAFSMASLIRSSAVRKPWFARCSTPCCPGLLQLCEGVALVAAAGLQLKPQLVLRQALLAGADLAALGLGDLVEELGLAPATGLRAHRDLEHQAPDLGRRGVLRHAEQQQVDGPRRQGTDGGVLLGKVLDHGEPPVRRQALLTSAISWKTRTRASWRISIVWAGSTRQRFGHKSPSYSPRPGKPQQG